MHVQVYRILKADSKDANLIEYAARPDGTIYKFNQRKMDIVYKYLMNNVFLFFKVRDFQHTLPAIFRIFIAYHKGVKRYCKYIMHPITKQVINYTDYKTEIEKHNINCYNCTKGIQISSNLKAIDLLCDDCRPKYKDIKKKDILKFTYHIRDITNYITKQYNNKIDIIHKYAKQNKINK